VKGKVCRDCQDWKILDQFYKGGGPLGRSTYCKCCDTKRSKAYYEANREKVAARQARYNEANREKYLATHARYFETHKAEIHSKNVVYYQANKKKILARQAARRKLPAITG